MTTTLFLDASAIVAMVADEPDGEELARTMSGYAPLLCSPIVLWEAVVAVARKNNVAIERARSSLDQFADRFAIHVRPIGMEETRSALAAWARFGKGSGHPARLNMGDCFAYACAKTNNARLLYKGDDFAQTDLA